MQRATMKKHTIQVPSPRPYILLDAGEDLEQGVAVRAPLLRQVRTRATPPPWAC
uniref:Predicted protein n=1 Tax=Hordeum vulgare subsp. vulgare TaxID=112509 RepID=F2D2D2_HORVV|nr:predicted protein [Hordeum vulgare subsp. vulgare]